METETSDILLNSYIEHLEEKSGISLDALEELLSNARNFDADPEPYY